MLIDLKYHLTSLIAVFLALAIGILAGSSLIAGSSIERQIAKGLEKEFGKLRIENQQQQAELQNLQNLLDKHNQFADKMLPALTNGRLARNRVAIIQTGDYSNAVQMVKSCLEKAGAQVSSITTLPDLTTEDIQPIIINAVLSITGETNNPDPVNRVLQIIANSIVTGSNTDAIKILESKNILTSSGYYDQGTWRIVLIGGSKEKPGNRASEIDLPLIEKLKNAGVLTVVGTEPVRAEVSYITDYKSMEIPTVDNVDEAMGQIALIFALSGESGNFGVKKSADKVIPSFLEDKLWRSEYRR
ncbi:MAG: copper transporter [Armatimonadota bacterium]